MKMFVADDRSNSAFITVAVLALVVVVVMVDMMVVMIATIMMAWVMNVFDM